MLTRVPFFSFRALPSLDREASAHIPPRIPSGRSNQSETPRTKKKKKDGGDSPSSLTATGGIPGAPRHPTGSLVDFLVKVRYGPAIGEHRVIIRLGDSRGTAMFGRSPVFVAVGVCRPPSCCPASDVLLGGDHRHS